MVTTKMKAAFTSMVKAMIMAPNTIKGERRNSRSTILTPFCTWFTSEVIRVIMVDVPRVSISVKERLWMWLKRACFNPVEKPTAALAAKYCAVIEQTRPINPSAINKSPICRT